MSDQTIFARSIEEAAELRELLNVTDAGSWQAGSAEPWIAHLVMSLLIANNTKFAIEIGGFQGYTSKSIAEALAFLPGQRAFTVCEIDTQRTQDVRNVLQDFHSADLNWTVTQANSLNWIPTLTDASVDFVWVDGNHEAAHVLREIELLLPKMRPGGLICGHDVFGVCDLNKVFAYFGGYSLDLARLGPAGGIGIIQVPR